MFYIGIDLPEEVTTLIKEADKKQFHFFTNEDRTDFIISSLKEKCKKGLVAVFISNNCLGILSDSLPGVVVLDSIRGKNTSIFDYIKFLKELVKEISDNSKINRIETRVIDKDLQKLSKKTGFELEGTLKESWLLPDGTYTDSYMFGYIIRRN